MPTPTNQILSDSELARLKALLEAEIAKGLDSIPRPVVRVLHCGHSQHAGSHSRCLACQVGGQR